MRDTSVGIGSKVIELHTIGAGSFAPSVVESSVNVTTMTTMMMRMVVKNAGHIIIISYLLIGAFYLHCISMNPPFVKVIYISLV